MGKTSVQSSEYIIFPISLLGQVFKGDKSCFEDMLIYGVMKMAKHIQINPDNALGLCVYDCIEGETVPKSITAFIKEMGIDRYALFGTYGYPACQDLYEDWEKFTKRNNDEAFEYGTIRRAIHYLGLTGKVFDIRKRYYEIESSNEQITVMIKQQMIFSYLKEDKSEYDLATFCIYASIKSILGKNKVVKTNKEMIIKRAFGDNQEMAEKYSTRRKFDKIMSNLELDWGVSRYAERMRGFFVSTSLPMKELAFIAEERRKENRLKKLKQEKVEARKAALHLLQITSFNQKNTIRNKLVN